MHSSTQLQRSFCGKLKSCRTQCLVSYFPTPSILEGGLILRHLDVDALRAQMSTCHQTAQQPLFPSSFFSTLESAFAPAPTDPRSLRACAPRSRLVGRVVLLPRANEHLPPNNCPASVGAVRSPARAHCPLSASGKPEMISL